jgi:hypothetical protein
VSWLGLRVRESDIGGRCVGQQSGPASNPAVALSHLVGNLTIVVTRLIGRWVLLRELEVFGGTLEIKSDLLLLSIVKLFITFFNIEDIYLRNYF